MKSLLGIAFAFLSVAISVCAARPERGEMKGMELYSWNEGGQWIFVLTTGTNRAKSEQEVKRNPNRIDSVAALTAWFMELAKGEHVMWNFHTGPGFSFPDPKTYDQVFAAAKRAEIALVPATRNEKG